MNKHPSFIHQVKGFIREHSLICAHDRILVAFSGGPDSTALTEALLTLKPEIDFQMALFHLNHGLRGEESVRDELFCQSWAQWQGIDLFIEHCDVCRYHQDHHALSLEEAAREVRYQMLQRVAERWKATKIALGHQADDQTETVLMNIIRGCGIDGLRGMAPEKEMYIRPLLTCRREDIMDFLRQRGIPFVDDSTNQDTRFLRNRIRHRLLPLLRDEYNPGIDDSLIRLAFNIQETLVLGHSLPVKQLGEFFSLPLASLAGLSIGEKDRLIRDYVQTVKGDLRHISREHIRSILYLAGKGKGETILPGELKIWIHDQSLYARIGDILFATVPQWSYPLQFPGRNDIPEIGLCIEF
ncbi:MAG: tRNA lysidine(34) synthetase TilS, partial [Candidatus Atribacteria bacterium]|nr:tRNA lysidine(34) synthetase TilS [Candidatus Atribacteria bacterium]